MEIGKNVKEFAMIAFTLLGVLFGMMIMTFVFSQLGIASSDTLADDTITRLNVTGAFINETGFTIPDASNASFNGGFSIILASNFSSNETIPAANYLVDATRGIITNNTNLVYLSVNMSYTYLQKTEAKQASESTQNNSLQSIVTYTNQSNTQFTTVAIAITLVILIAVFLLFWRVFVKNKSKKEGSRGNFM